MQPLTSNLVTGGILGQYPSILLAQVYSRVRHVTRNLIVPRKLALLLAIHEYVGWPGIYRCLAREL